LKKWINNILVLNIYSYAHLYLISFNFIKKYKLTKYELIIYNNMNLFSKEKVTLVLTDIFIILKCHFLYNV